MKYKVTLLMLLALITALSSQADSNAPWGIQMVALNSGETRHIRYNEQTGETWWSKNLVWKKITEIEPIPHSIYEFKVVSAGLSWRTLRIDKLTGQTWKNSKGKWKEIKIEK